MPAREHDNSILFCLLLVVKVIYEYVKLYNHVEEPSIGPASHTSPNPLPTADHAWWFDVCHSGLGLPDHLGHRYHFTL